MGFQPSGLTGYWGLSDIRKSDDQQMGREDIAKIGGFSFQQPVSLQERIADAADRRERAARAAARPSSP
jgi:hypothetical protein